MLDTLTGWITDALTWAISCLPNSPFQQLSNSVISQYLPLLNWIFPFSFIVSTMEVWLSAVVTYYVYSAILRWTKAVQ